MAMAQFQDNTPGVPATFNAVLETYFADLELTTPFIAPPERVVNLEAGETFTMSGVQPSSIINANAGGCTIIFTQGGWASEARTVNRSALIVGDNYTVTADGITFSVPDSPTVVYGHGTIGWRALNINSQTVSADMADRIYSKKPLSFDQNISDAEAWVKAELIRYLKIEQYGNAAAYSRINDGPAGGFAPSVTFPAPPLQSGTTTLPIRAWRGGIHRVEEIPSGNASHTIELDLSEYTQDLTESGPTSTAYVHFENREADVGIPFTFVNLPAGITWQTDPIIMFGGASTMNVLNYFSIRIDRIGNQLIAMPFCYNV